MDQLELAEAVANILTTHGLAYQSRDVGPSSNCMPSHPNVGDHGTTQASITEQPSSVIMYSSNSEMEVSRSHNVQSQKTGQASSGHDLNGKESTVDARAK